MAKIRLILADDHAVVRSGIRMLLEAQPDIEIVAEAETGRQAVEQVRRLKPDVVLMDVQMPELNGIEATQQIKKMVPGTAVLALTMHEDDQYFFEMIRAGASGYVPKRAAPDDLVTAIRTVARGEIFVLIAEGLTNAEIANRLVISVKTVDRHRENIMRKLNMHNRIDLVKYAIRKGLIDLDE
jgi:two-component system response regulator NreC